MSKRISELFFELRSEIKSEITATITNHRERLNVASQKIRLNNLRSQLRSVNQNPALSDVEFSDLSAAGVFLGHFLDRPADRSARAAPGRPEVDEYGQFAV